MHIALFGLYHCAVAKWADTAGAVVWYGVGEELTVILLLSTSSLETTASLR